MTAINMLLDNATDALPIMGELTSLVSHQQVDRLVEDLRIFVPTGGILAIACVLTKMGVLGIGAFMMVGGVYLMNKSVQPATVGKFEVWGIKASWQGPAGVGMMVLGTVVIVIYILRYDRFEPLLKSLGICSA
jgi:hypothetical protein